MLLSIYVQAIEARWLRDTLARRTIRNRSARYTRIVETSWTD